MLDVRNDRRSRSKSPGGRDRDRSRSRDARASPPRTDPRRSSKKYAASESESDDDRRYKSERSSKKYYEEDEDKGRYRSTTSSTKYVEEDEDDGRYRSSKSTTESRRREVSDSDDERRYERSKKKSDSDSDRRRERERERERERDKASRKNYEPEERISDEDRRKYSSRDSRDQNGRNSSGGYAEVRPRETRHASYVATDPRYAVPGRAPSPPDQRMHSFSGSTGQKYADVDQYKYAQPTQYAERKSEYERTRTSTTDSRRRDEDYQNDKHESRGKKYHEDRYETREPRDKKYNDDKYGSSPDDSHRKRPSLTVGGAMGAATLGVVGLGSHGGGGKPPASPLLEPYKGTYQTISPMPSALVLANHKDDSDLSDLDLELDEDSDDPNADLKRKIRKLELEKERYDKDQRKSVTLSGSVEIRPRSHSRVESISETTRMEIREPGGKHERERSSSNVSIMIPGGSGKKKSVSFYDPTDDAKRIAAALSGTRSAPDPRPLVQILPYLSTDDLLALRTEYKQFAKINGQGINIAKHIKMRVTGNLGKASYATALGRWESEAYWANSWYQGGASRRELLIESLMGRTNSDIREIKNCFKDKKYNDDLEKCIRTELRADKFRTAILLALEERRMPESSPLDIKLIKSDVQDLAHSLDSAGGESDMIKIIVMRSDVHLREVLRLFERTYGVNFARQMISKSRNLVGETLAHVLNGALNRPMRDALLLHQAISETAPGKERTELLISRLVRLHWEPKHLQKVKAVYRERYKRSVEEEIKREVLSQMKTPEGRLCAEFCIALAESSSYENGRSR